jgi:hypothetical protein
MRVTNKLITAFVFLALFLQVHKSFAFSFVVPVAKSLTTTVGLSAKYLKVSEFVKLSPREFSQLTGKKLNVFQRISFQIAKLKMKHDLKKNPDLTLSDYGKSPKDQNNGFSFLWFILGIAGPIIGLFTTSIFLFFFFAFAPVIIAYITKQDKVYKKSVWTGFGVGILLILLLIILIITSIGYK